MSKLNRNVRNHNPLNIESRDDWLGLAPQQNDSRFAVFNSPEYGFRAAYIILLRYLERNDDTVIKIINKWAPASDNNHVGNYSQFVAKRAQLDVKSRITVNELPQVILAMADFEGAQGAYSLSQVYLGVELAHQESFVQARLAKLGQGINTAPLGKLKKAKTKFFHDKKDKSSKKRKKPWWQKLFS
ncbi:structural protein [Psychrobium sp. 1_MG-2023]|uniref:structural protein n=1 Tax=Psychrobium sp. 1_MG-2023 TaxID=3062624 RepID=UPI000C3266B4|nr:structural protein [Psychrobium sp. 1_MG-2023]MDP2560121.1 hypothetical protein [Psychrobium sp. 1_MG-2023]PKF56934.1 structural protein [Alteromonadales bacterium alter-6D02]